MATRKSKSAPSSIVVVGSFNQDMVWQGARFPQPGETRLGRFSTGPGGKGFNQALACVRQGATTAFIAAIGRDALGEAAERLAVSEHLDARWQHIASEATGTAAIWLDAQGQNMIVVAAGANALLSPAHVLAQSALIQGARVLLTQHEVHPVATLRAMEIAAAAGVLRIHNPAPPVEAGPIDSLLKLADVLTPNETEFAALLARRDVRVDAGTLSSLDDDSLHALCRQLDSGTLVITLGGAGAFVSHRPDCLHGDSALCYRVAAQPAHPVDTTGAGDACNGGLAASLAGAPERPFAAHVEQAMRVAGCAIEAHGAALAMPTRLEVGRRFPQ